MSEQFDDRARRAIMLADDEARLLDDDFVGTEHVLLGLVREGRGAAARVLTSLGISLENARRRTKETSGRGQQGSRRGPLPLTPRTTKILQMSSDEARRFGYESVDTEHVLLALINEGNGVGVQILERMDVQPSSVRQHILEQMLLDKTEMSQEARFARRGRETPEGTGNYAALTTITGVLRKFPTIVRELAVRHSRRPPFVEIKDEYDVQDLLRGVLRGLFNDIRKEEHTPSHGGLTSRMDLLLKREQIVIETKMTRDNLDQRGIAQELAIDKEVYRTHPDCRALVCFVYDPDRRLANPTALESDLSSVHGSMSTIVIVAPID